MTLEGSLEAFSLPDIFQLLSYTKKSGALHITRGPSAGVVYFTTGSVTGGTSDISRQSLGRRLVGAGAVDDAALNSAIAAVQKNKESGLAKALHSSGAVDEAVLHEHVVEQATDCVFDLLRWQQGEFAFVADEPNPDDIGMSLPVDEVIAEARKRLDQWDALTRKVSSPELVVVVVLRPPAPEITMSVEEWRLLALADGRRTVADLVRLAGRGEFAAVRTLASLVDRGIVAVVKADESTDDGVAALLRRQGELSRLEGRSDTDQAPEPPPPAPPQRAMSPRPEVALVQNQQEERESPPVAPARAEPIRARGPEFPESAPRRVAPAARTAGSAALAEAPSPTTMIERDPSVNKSLLLRLIAGVRGL